MIVRKCVKKQSKANRLKSNGRPWNEMFPDEVRLRKQAKKKVSISIAPKEETITGDILYKCAGRWRLKK